MVNLREVLDNLPVVERRKLMHAFDNGLPAYVILNNRKYIGVNIEYVKNLTETQRAGYWSYGEVHGHVAET